MRARTLAVLASFVTGAAVAAGACGETLPSDQTSSSSSSGTGGATSSSTTTTTTTTVASSGGMGGAGTGGAGTGGGTGGALDCFPHPTTHVEIINACTTAQEIDLMPVLPLLDMDGGLPPLP